MNETTARPRPSRSTQAQRRWAIAAVAVIALAGSCSSDGGDDEDSTPTTADDATSLTMPGDEATDDTDDTETDDADDAALPEGWVQYEAEGITIDHPEAWTTEENPQAAMVLMIDPEGMPFRRNINILVQPEAGSMSLEEYVELTDEQLTEAGAVTSDSGATTLDGEPAHQWRYVATFSGQEVEVWTIAALHDGAAYVVTYTGEIDSFDEQLPVVEQSFATVDLP